MSLATYDIRKLQFFRAKYVVPTSCRTAVCTVRFSPGCDVRRRPAVRKRPISPSSPFVERDDVLYLLIDARKPQGRVQ
jgi:hypothetical protein